MPPAHSRPRAFSLIEVVIAVGLFSGTVVVLLALLPLTLRESAGAADFRTALGLADAVEAGLHRLVAERGFETVAAALPVAGAGFDEGELLVATRAGEELRSPAAGGGVDRDQFFLIELRRFGPGPLAYDAAGAVLAVQVRVSWPYRPLTPEGLRPAHPAAGRHRITFSLAVNR